MGLGRVWGGPRGCLPPLGPSGPGTRPGGAQAQLLSLEIPGEGHFLS